MPKQIQSTYIDGWPGLARAISQAPKAYPLRKYGNIQHATYSREYNVGIDYFTPTLLGTKDPLAAGYYLTDETQPEIKQGKLATFTRSYANIPEPTYTASTVTFTRPASIGSFSGGAGAVRYMGTEAGGDRGIAVRTVANSQTLDLYTSHAVTGDAGASSTPTGGTFTITVANLGTTSALYYNATAATMQTALREISGYDAAYHAITVSDISSFNQQYSARIDFTSTLPEFKSVSGSGMSYTGVSASTSSSMYSASISWDSSSEWRMGDSSKPMSELIALGYILLQPASVVSESSSEFGFNLPTWYTKSALPGSTPGYNAYVRPYNARLKIVGYNSTQYVQLPADLSDASAISAFRDSFISAYATAHGASVGALGGPYKYDAAASWNGYASETATPYLFVAGFAIKFQKQYYGTDILMPRIIQASAPSGWSALFGWSGHTVTVNASTTKASLQSAINALPPVTGCKITASIDSLIQNQYGVSLSVSVGPNRSCTVNSSVTPSPSNVAIVSYIGSRDTSTLFKITASVTDRTLTFAYPHNLDGVTKLYVKQGSSYQYAVLPYTVSGSNTITVSNTESRWQSSVSEVGQFIKQYTPGTETGTVREVMEYFRVSASGQYATPDKIPVSTQGFSDDAYISALFNPTVFYTPYEASSLEEYLPGIWKRTTKELRVK